jgi:hypothetical protein
MDFPLRQEMPEPERTELRALLSRMPARGIPDTVAYLSEDEVMGVLPDLEALGYDPEGIQMAFRAAPRSVDYFHFFLPA